MTARDALAAARSLLFVPGNRPERFGFAGKLLSHPRQVGPVHAAFAPGEAEIAWAERVVAADTEANGAAVQLDGKMVDQPVVALARRTLALARTDRMTTT